MTARRWLRQVQALTDPSAVVAGRVLLERGAAQRADRLRDASLAAIRERARPSRPRMRAVVLGPGGRLSHRAVPVPPAPGPLAAVVRPLAVATCDMDRPIALGATPFVAPLAFGHECVAEVLRVGGAVAHVRVGQRVVVPFQISCGSCAPCRAGLTASCLSVPPASMYGFGVSGGHWGGALADELGVPFADAMLVPLPDALDPVAAASVADNVSDAYRHLGPHLPGLLGREPGARVLIVGAVSPRHRFTASVALYAGLVARALGAGHVTLADARPEVRGEAEALGLTALTPKAAAGQGPAPLVVDVSATSAGLRFAVGMTAADGTCSSSGSLHATARIPTLKMYGRNVTLSVGRAHARTLIPQVLELMSAGRLRPERVTTCVASMEDAPAALAEHMNGGATKTVLTV